MKLTLFSAICIMLLCSCADDMLPLEPLVQTEEVKSRAMTTPEVGESTSNPNLIDDWESQTQVVLNSGRVEELPWSNNGVSTQLSSDFCKKIKKSEGWTMLMHTFQAVGESRQQNYMMFYNLFTGVVKVFDYGVEAFLPPFLL